MVDTSHKSSAELKPAADVEGRHAVDSALADRKRLRLLSFAIFAFALVFIEGLEALLRPYATDGFYFQSFSSETLVQTVPLQDLRDAPLVSLYYIHIQPPGLDALRALIVAIWPAADLATALRHVDDALYWIWAILYALMGLLIFVWCTSLMGSLPALIASILFLLHPAALYYATFLDSTFLSALLILFMFYLLWRIRSGLRVPIPLFASVVLGLFFFRSVFQWPALLVFLASLYLLKVSGRKLLIFLLLAGGICGLYLAKQYYLFHLTSSSSFTGLNLMNSIGMHQPYVLGLSPEAANRQLPDVLTRTYKATGDVNFNRIDYLQRNQELTEQFFSTIRHMSPAALAAGYLVNTGIYFEPSSVYWPHAIVDRLPWRSFYDQVFSSPILPLLLLAAGMLAAWKSMRRRSYREDIALLLPALYIFLTCVLFERGENMRFKYFLEPAMFTFLVAQFYSVIQDLVRRLTHRLPPEPSPKQVA